MNLLKRKNWAVFISGQGSNLRALLKSPEILKINLIVCSKESAPGLTFARRAGVPIYILPKPIDWEKLDAKLREAGVTSIFLLGFMRLLPEEFVDKWRHKILNLHPSLLPKYAGLNSIERAYNEQSDIGITVHEVIPEMDAGPVVIQKKVLSGLELDGLSFESCEFKIHVEEQNLIRKAILSWK